MNAPVAVQTFSWAWYKAALADPKKIGSQDLPIHENEPHQGYYRMRKMKPEIGWVPVAITPIDGELVATVGLWSKADRRPATDVWTWCCRYPIHHAAIEKDPRSAINWTDVALNGQEFADSIAKELKTVPAAVIGEEPAPIGHNSGDAPADIFAELKEKIDDIASKALAESEKIGTVTAANWTPAHELKKNRLGNYVDEISTLKSKIEDAFEIEKKPWRDGGTAVDVKWRALKAKGPDTIKDLKKKLAELGNAESAFKTEEARKAAEAARVASPELDDTAIVVQPVKVTAGTVGRKIPMVTVYEATITDPLAFAGFVLGKDHVKTILMDALQRVANSYAKFIVDGDVVAPGITAKSKQVAR